MSHKFKKRSKFDKGLASKIAACVIAVIALFSMLYFVVVALNSEECEKMGLNGSLFGCKVNEKFSFSDIVFVVGNTANAPAPELPAQAKKIIQNSTQREELNISIYSAAKDRSKISFKNPSQDDDTGDSVDRVKQKSQQYIDEIDKAIKTPPTSDGVAYLDAALRAGRTALRDAENSKEGKAVLIVIGSGLSDSGLLDFTSGLIDEENKDRKEFSAEKIRDKLIEEDQIEQDSLKGLSLYWFELGNVALPQDRLSDRQVSSLKKIYETIFDELGVKIGGISEGDKSNLGPVNTNFKVKTVRADSGTVIWEGAFDNNSALRFVIDSADFVEDKDVVLGTLKDPIEKMRRSPSSRAEVIGYVGRFQCPQERPNDELALNRANAVRQIFIDAGIPSEKVEAINGGFGPENECREDGSIDREKQSRNLKTTITIKGE